MVPRGYGLIETRYQPCSLSHFHIKDCLTYRCLACSSCPLGRFRAGCEGSHPGNCKDCSRPSTDEFFTGSGGIGQDDCSTSKVAIIKPGCTNVQDCAAWYQGYKWAAVTFTHDSERFGMDISFSLVPQGKPDMGECASSRKGLSTITTCGDSSQLL